ncbi:MAG: pyrroline-5-carboxylate reductase [Thermaceae bacterium]
MRLVIVGPGKMGQSILRGVLERGFLLPEEVGVLGRTPERTQELARSLGVRGVGLQDRAGAERILIAVKPQDFPALAPRIAHPSVGYISIMAGVSTKSLERRLGTGRVVRAMPNLAVEIGESSTALFGPKEAEEAGDLAFARGLFATVGNVYEIPESLFDAFTGMSASAPAYLAVVAEALADGGVRMGLPRSLALKLAADALAATGKLLKRSHPAQVKDQVASPAGTTIHGLYALEAHGVRAALMEAVERATQRGKALGGLEEA